jgi:hypothetical protein
VGVALTGLLHAPAWESISAYVRFQDATEYHAVFGVLDVVALLAGSRPAAVALLWAAPFALAAILARRGWRGLPLVLAAAGPCAVVAIAAPYGGPYAYARYVLPAVPFLCVAFGGLVAWIFERTLPAPRPRTLATLAVGAALAVLLFATGPYGLRHTADGPYANTYITMYPLPAFDVAWDGWPDFYDELAGDREVRRIIEVPALVSRSRHLYRNYYLRHGVETWLGFAYPWELEDPPAGPYVSFDGPDWRERADADYLILHTSIGRELRRYWDFVFSLDEDPSVAAFMARQQRYAGYGGQFAALPDDLQRRLRDELGPPDYADAEVRVWRLRDRLSGPRVR